MQAFNYVIKDEVGMHARPAGLLVKKAKEYDSTVYIVKNDKEADATRLMALMSLGVKCGDEITVRIEGTDEEKCAKELLEFFENNL